MSASATQGGGHNNFIEVPGNSFSGSLVYLVFKDIWRRFSLSVREKVMKERNI